MRGEADPDALLLKFSWRDRAVLDEAKLDIALSSILTLTYRCRGDKDGKYKRNAKMQKCIKDGVPMGAFCVPVSIDTSLLCVC